MKKDTLYSKIGTRATVVAAILLSGLLTFGAIRDIAVFTSSPNANWGEIYHMVLSPVALAVLIGLLISLAKSSSKARFWFVHDSVTSLPLKTEIPRTVVRGSSAYVFIRLKEYYQYLERYGLSSSDSYIRVGAQAIQDVFQNYIHVIYQFSDAEFLAVTKFPRAAEDIQQRFQHLAEVLTEKVYEINTEEAIRGSFVVSIGIAPVEHASDVELLTTYAKFASLEAGQNEGASAVLFDLPRYLEYQTVVKRRHHVYEVIENAEITTVFQPIISCNDGELYGYEALTRPTNPAFRNIAELLDDAEILGVYTQLEFLMTLTAIQSFRKLNAEHTRLFINLAGKY